MHVKQPEDGVRNAMKSICNIDENRIQNVCKTIKTRLGFEIRQESVRFEHLLN